MANFLRVTLERFDHLPTLGEPSTLPAITAGIVYSTEDVPLRDALQLAEEAFTATVHKRHGGSGDLRLRNIWPDTQT